MARTKIKWNVKAFEAIRRLPGVENELQSEVDRVLASVGKDDYDGGVGDGRSRSRGYVVTKTAKAIRAEHKSHKLLRALGGGK
jgi:hypothetical protein